MSYKKIFLAKSILEIGCFFCGDFMINYDRELNIIIDSIKNKDEVMDIYFKILDFLRISEYYGSTHRLLGKIEGDNVTLSYNCLDASDFLLKTIKNSIYGITFFSATLYPITYYMDLLTKGNGKYLELLSPFDPNNLNIIIFTIG